MSAVSTSYGTYLSNLFNPQVVGDRINKKLWDYVRFSPLARIDNTLEGRPGNTITLPYYNKSITAQVTNEGQDITLSKLTESTTTVTIKKIAAGCQITDEALLSAYGNPMDEAIDQIPEVVHKEPLEYVPDVVAALNNDQVEAITYSAMSAAKLLDSYPDFVLCELESGFTGDYASNNDNAGIAKGNDDILKKINEAIADVSEEERADLWTACNERMPV